MTNAVAKWPFQFYTRLHLQELTGLRAATLGQLLKLLERVPDAAIYHHTHQFLQQYHYLVPQPPNDFAFWAETVLGDDILGERLASVDPMQFSTIRDLRERLVTVLRRHLQTKPFARLRTAPHGREFHFIKSLSFIAAIPYQARDLAAFAEAIQRVTIDTLYFHLFEARLRLPRGTNNFSVWLEEALGEQALARQVAELDPYSQTLEEVRQTIIRLVRARLAEQRQPAAEAAR